MTKYKLTTKCRDCNKEYSIPHTKRGNILVFDKDWNVCEDCKEKEKLKDTYAGETSETIRE